MPKGTAEKLKTVPEKFHRGPVVYFIGGEDGPVKIGFTNELPSRLRSLQNSSPVSVQLLAAIRGGRDVEVGYHRHFEADRLHGEWFARSEAIEEEIARLVWMPHVLFKFGRDVEPVFHTVGGSR